MSDLNTPQKDTLKNAIKTSSTRSQVAEEQTKANAINDAMHVLRQNIANNENVKIKVVTLMQNLRNKTLIQML